MTEIQLMLDEETEPVSQVDDTCIDLTKSGKVAIYKDYDKTNLKRLKR